MSISYFYRANVQWSQNGKLGMEHIPVYAFKGDAKQGWYIRWPSLTVEDLSLHMNNVNSNYMHQFTLVTDAYLANRAFPGRDVRMLDVFVHDSLQRESPMVEATVIATIRKSDMTVVSKTPVGSLARMTCERLDTSPGANSMMLNGHYVAVTLGFTGKMSFNRT